MNLYRYKNKKETDIHPNFIYSEIFHFCSTHRNKGNALENSFKEYPPRVSYIIELLEKYQVPYKVHTFTTKVVLEDGTIKSNIFHNIYLPGHGKTGRLLTSHHDIVNPHSHNANDNSCSIINSIAYKLQNPEAWVAIFDGEEVGMIGARDCVRQIENRLGFFENFTPSSVLNLELTGIGGCNFFYGTNGTSVNEDIESLFPNAPAFETPPNDAIIFQEYGIPATVITTLPITQSPSTLSNENGYLDLSILKRCHKMRDSVHEISTVDMKLFVTNVLTPIMKYKS